jgi:hypothetical protein
MKFEELNMRGGKNLAGIKFGDRVVLDDVKRISKKKSTSTYWNTVCKCGKVEFVNYSNLKRNSSCSECGKIKSAKTIKSNAVCEGDTSRDSSYHGLYLSYREMFTRCYKKTSPYYSNNLDTVVEVCKEWGEYLTFKEWSIENGWKKGLAICRHMDKGNYEPSNCRWDTRVNNTLEYHSYSKYLNIGKLSAEDVRDIKNAKLKRGVLSISDLAKKFDLKYSTIASIRCGKGYDGEKYDI